MKDLLKRQSLAILSFVLPALGMILLYYSQEIYWSSPKTALLGDGFHQYVIFDTALRDILQGKDSLFYSFTTGLGLNFYALSSYYLGSFFSPLVYFFDVRTMPNALYLFTILKFACIGLSSFISIKGSFKQLKPYLALVLSLCYSFMSFTVSQLEIKTWLDVFILVPLILYGLDKLIKEGKVGLYYVSLTILLIQNYYFGYMMVIFLPLWYLVQLSWDFKKRLSSLSRFIVTSILAGTSSAIMLVPTLLDLRGHGESLTQIDRLLTEDSWYLDIFAKTLVGAFDTTKYGAIPMIYVGLIPLILSLCFFLLKSIRFHVKLSYGLLISFLIASFYLEGLDLFWQGFHAPNMFLHRYSWLFSVLLVFMAATVLERLEELQFKQVLLANLFLACGWGLTWYFSSKHYTYLDSTQFLLTFEFLGAYLLLFWAYKKAKLSPIFYTVAVSFFLIVEIGCNSFYQIQGIAGEWGFASLDSYQRGQTEILALKDKMEKGDYRAELGQVQTGNDTMKYGLNGISQFSSVRNRLTSGTLDVLGYKSSGSNLNLRYQNNTILMDSLFGIRYLIGKNLPPRLGFTTVARENDYRLEENNWALPLAFLTQEVYKDIKLSSLTLDNQRNLLHHLTGLDSPLFEEVPIYENNLERSLKKEGDVPPQTSFVLQAPANQQLYLSLPNIQFPDDEDSSVQLHIDGNIYTYTLDNTFSFFDLGYFPEAKEVTIKLLFPGASKASYGQPHVYNIPQESLENLFNKLKENQPEVRIEGNKLNIHYQTDKPRSLFVTLPYDKGWKAYQNGQEIPIRQAQTGFMALDLAKGSDTIQLVFVPQGFYTSFWISSISLLAFLVYRRFLKTRAG
ncbi:YfhO family protein [Streptococcus danieliae]|uniref:YfhO family protein n=1 Tax=Streptococcus danieliae TaxID=747656 RepID=A0A7Z0M5W8_9STRE|nr:YfhO family protein [Streptococcus danieliae]MBF0698868.1 YfhO family protein [Streptococcus danieliae]NYS96045.1 YfhO family protein [Streptococcus danieliae]